MTAAVNAKLIKGLVFLVVDGQQYSRNILRSMLLQLGVKSIYDATDGVAALEIIRAVDPNVMLVDWNLPVMNGRKIELQR